MAASNTNPTQLTDTGLQGALKTVYAKFRVQTFPILTPIIANIKRGAKGGPENMKFGGLGVNFDVVLGRPTGTTASATGQFPPSTIAPEKQATIGIARTYVRRQVDGLALLATEADQASYVPLAKKVVMEAIDASRLMQQEVTHGDGKGIRGVVTSATSTTVLVCSSPYGVAGEGALLLDVGMYVNVLTANGVTNRGGGTITTAVKSGDSVTITLDTALTSPAANDVVVSATLQDNSFKAYPQGLISITNRGGSYAVFQGIDQGTYARWDSVRMVAGQDTSNAAAPTETDIWKLITAVRGKSGKDAKLTPNEFLLVTTPGIEQKLADSLLSQRRFEANSALTLKGGFKAVNICGLPLISDPWCPPGTIYLIHLPTMVYVDLLDWAKLSFEGAGPWRFVANVDAYEVNYGAYWNLGALQRNSQGSITGYVDNDRYSMAM